MSTRALVGRGGDRHRNPLTNNRLVLTIMSAGLALTILATVFPYVDRATSHTLADHIRAGYPTYSQARVDGAVTTYLVYLSIAGFLGVVGWLSSVLALRTGRRWARGAATAMFLLGTSVALTHLLIKDTSGDTGLPPLMAWLGIVPCVPGLLAVILLWRRREEFAAIPTRHTDQTRQEREK